MQLRSMHPRLSNNSAIGMRRSPQILPNDFFVLRHPRSAIPRAREKAVASAAMTGMKLLLRHPRSAIPRAREKAVASAGMTGMKLLFARRFHCFAGATKATGTSSPRLWCNRLSPGLNDETESLQSMALDILPDDLGKGRG